MTYFGGRIQSTDERLAKLAASISRHLATDAARILQEDTCIYVVGSGGRGEMSEHSDADLFVTRVGRAPSSVDAFQVREAIARALFDEGLPAPSQGGEYLKMHTAAGLCELMGTPQDDVENTFTARMLLLLESRPLLGTAAYDALLTSVIATYWKNDGVPARKYHPFVLVNDVVRYWRILLLNYVAKNTEKEKELAQPQRDAERRLRSYKLRFSRCMTCFSALTSLLAVTGAGGVTQKQVLAIVKRRPIERLEDLRSQRGKVALRVDELLKRYKQFLRVTSEPKKDLIGKLTDSSYAARRAKEGAAFGNAMFELLQELGRTGRGKELFRHMVV